LNIKSVRTVTARSKGRCEAKLHNCCYVGTQFHHIKAKARGGSDTPKNLLLVCHACHLAITDNRPGTERFRMHGWQ